MQTAVSSKKLRIEDIKIDITSRFTSSHTSLVKCVFVQRANDIRLLAPEWPHSPLDGAFFADEKLQPRTRMSMTRKTKSDGGEGRQVNEEKCVTGNLQLTKPALKTGITELLKHSVLLYNISSHLHALSRSLKAPFYGQQ